MRTICPGEGCREQPKKQKRRCGNSSVAAAFLWPDSEKALKSRAFGQNEKVGNFCQNYLPFLAERKGFEPLCAFAQTDFESSGKNRTWRNFTEDNGRCENPENAVFSRLSAPVRIENAVKIRVRKSPPISPSSNGFSEKPIRIFDRTERFFAPKSRFWQCVKSAGYAGLHPKSCEKMPGWNQNCRYRQKYK